MEILTVITLGIIAIILIISFIVLTRYIEYLTEIILDQEYYNSKVSFNLIKEEHKKTRKETQEIKTRLTQVRKDLNKIETITYKLK